jgi:flagellar hook-basal body complex protein FliE
MASIDSRPSTSLQLPLTAKLLAGRGLEHLPLSAGETDSAGGQLDFARLLGQGVAEVNSLQNQSTQSVQEMLTGGDVQPAEVFASVQKADMAFRMLLQVRNKLMQAYEEVNQIRI